VQEEDDALTRAPWLGVLAQYRWLLGIGTGAGLAVAVGIVLIFLPHQADHRPRALAVNCGIVTCTATLPVSPSPRPSATPPGRSPRMSATPPGPSPRMSATAVMAPSPMPPAPRQAPLVTVAYSVVQRWDGGFQGQFTIVNHASTALTGWQIRAAFPGDLVDSAWGAGWQISGGGTLVLDAPSYQPTVPPGASQSANFTARGNTTSPVSCSIDGLTCGNG
jgi:hypothetical protein